MITVANASSHMTHHHQAVSPVAAGFIGAGVTLAVVIAALVLASLLGLIGIGSRKKQSSRVAYHDGASDEKTH